MLLQVKMMYWYETKNQTTSTAKPLVVKSIVNSLRPRKHPYGINMVHVLKLQQNI